MIINDDNEFNAELQAESAFEENCLGNEECCLDTEVAEREDNFRDDVEADADALASAGWGTDEDYERETPMGHDFGGE